MKNQIVFLLLLLLSFSACKKTSEEQRAAAIPESVFSYVYAYTSGTISRTSDIKVRFAKNAISEDKVGTEAGKNLLFFSPKIEGKFVWENQRTLRFTPTEKLASGTVYVGKVRLIQIFPEAKGDAEKFEFDFRTYELNYVVKENGFKAKNANDLSIQEFEGQVVTTDFAEAEKVKKMLSATQSNKKLNIRWSHNSDGKHHNFTVENISRADEEGEFSLKHTGGPIGLSGSKILGIEIPGLNNFMVTEAEVTRGDQQQIRLNFSDPLQRNQNLEGLITINGFNGKMRYTIEGNTLLIYPASRLTGSRTISIATGVKNIAGKGMAEKSTYDLTFEENKPQVKIVGRGVILPSSDGLLMPIEAINLNAVEVEVFKIFSNNILQFLQNNDLQSNGNRLENVGRIVAQEKIDLRELSVNPNQNKWVRYALDLSKMIEKDPGAIYQVRIGFRPNYTSYFCGSEQNEEENLTIAGQDLEYSEEGEFTSIWNSYYGIDGYYDDYSYDDREDPCKGGYYNDDNFARRNILASDLGIIAKEGNDKTVFAAVSDLKSTEPISGATLEFYDYQQQLIKSVTTDSEGMNFTDLERSAAFLVASHNGQKGYLKLLDGNSLSLSRFDVSGAVTQKGLKGYIYGERGVWRPGDSLFLNFILEDKAQNLPAGHPINFKLYDPLGQVRKKRTIHENVNGIYALHSTTKSDAPTGNWRAEVKAGGATFTKTLKIETVKPNRLKAKLDFDNDILTPKDMPTKVQVAAKWLHGAPAKNSTVKVEMQVKQTSMKFPKFSEFRFTDPARKFSNVNQDVTTVFDGQTDANGQAEFPLDIYKGDNAPGKLRADFKTRVFEKGGDFSTINSSVNYNPYDAYTGILIPKNSWGSKRIPVDTEGKLEFAVVDTEGKPISGKKMKVGIYRAEWRWWWESNGNNIGSYASKNHFNALIKADVSSDKNGTATYSFTPKEWGRYLIRVCDEDGGHCSGDFVYSGYPWYGDDEDGGQREGATMLAFAASKEKYNVGETVEINVPANDIGRVLITLETGTKVLKSFWREAKKGDNTFTFPAELEMSPTVYAHVSLIQPHAQTVNDLPIRMYGVIPVGIANPATKLDPEIAMKAELKPEETFSVSVSEKNGKAMSYTLAVVDDGLLDLTNFRTPNPHGSFYAREALGVQTYDIYDQVLGAYGGDLSRILSIGGDVGVEGDGEKNKQANRFKPVVRHIGPFYLAKGKMLKHELTMPNYVGSVRVMVVAANESESAYGKAEKTVPVRKALMVLATLPRVLGPGETLRLPISVFAMDKKVKNASITVSETSGMVGISDDGKQNMSFAQIGEQMAYFDLKVAETTGIARFKVNAQGGGESASQEIEIEIRNPNPFVTNVEHTILKAGENWDIKAQLVGVAGTNEGILEISNLPPIDLGRRLKYLLGYPYGCLEQTTSKAFPQLYVNRLLELNEQQKKSIPQNVQAAIDRLSNFRISSGNFTYWPGGSSVNNWANNYAGHFILEAEKLGYTIPAGMKSGWIKAQTKTANIYDTSQEQAKLYHHGAQFTQSYRLYTLALANEPATAAMNRLRESKNLQAMPRWYLAGAYALSGKPEVAKQLIKSLDSTVEDYRELGNTFGSRLRDKAIILEVLTLLDEKERATELVKELSEQLSDGSWRSTQETAYALLAIGKFVGEADINSEFKFAYQIGGNPNVNAASSNPLVNIPVDMSSNTAQSIKLTNTSKSVLYARLITTGQPATGDPIAASNKLALSVNYTDTKGKTIDPTSIPQGTDFIAEVTVKHPGNIYKRRYDEMALDQIFPSGWEILNTRMDNLNQDDEGISRPDYQDVRDDRVYSFFDISYGQSQTYRVRLNAAYQGRYYLPTVSCEAMYDASVNARQPGMWVEVTGAEEG